MLKEIHDQPTSLSNVLSGRISADGLSTNLSGISLSPEEIKKFRREAKMLEQKSTKGAQELKTARDAVANAKKGFRTMLVSQAGPPRMVKILPRGNWLDKSGE